jgi:inhibitor of KinA sporulation pathway (predicted exonuclease)
MIAFSPTMAAEPAAIRGMPLGLPSPFALIDTEYTAWPGSKERGWSGPNEWRELVEIAAVRVEAATLREIESFRCLVKPRHNPVLSSYLLELTGLMQAEVDEQGIDAADAITRLATWIGTDQTFCFGNDGAVIRGNLDLYCLDQRLFTHEVGDIRQVFSTHGVDMTGYSSGTCTRAFGCEPQQRAHAGLNDVRTILEALRLLAARQGQL